MSSSIATAIVPSSAQQVAHRLVPSAVPSPQNAPTTPSTAGMPAAPVVQNTPGNFRHPRMNEVVARRNATQFNEKNVKVIAVNTAAIFLTFLVPSTYIDSLVSLASRTIHLSSVDLSASVIITTLRLLFLFNIVLSCRPLVPLLRQEDNMEDIPLTPSQRKLLGLPRSQTDQAQQPGASSPQTGGYITPPRYRRSSPSPAVSTPASGRSISAQYGASPLSTSRYVVGFSPASAQNSPSSNKRQPFSPSVPGPPNPPLLHRALAQSTSQNSLPVLGPDTNFSESTSHLFGESGMAKSAISTRDGFAVSQAPGTPSPRGRDRVKVDPGVNYKFLYDKGLKADGSPGANSF